VIAALLYAVTAFVLLALVHRFVQRLTVWPAAALMLLPLCFTGRALLTGRVYGPVDLPYMTEPLAAMRGLYGLGARAYNPALSDVAWQMIPWRAAEKSALAGGEWPLWNRFMFGGGPLAASAQPAVYSLFTLIACLLPIGAGTTYLASIWFFVAVLSAFVFAREIGCSESAALFAAAAWAFSTAVSFFILWPLGQSWTIAPLVLTAVARIVRSPTIRESMFLTIALVLLILAGHPESVMHVVLVGCAYGVVLLVRARLNVRRAVSIAVLGGGLALMITAIYLLPVMEALPQTGEYMVRKAEAGIATGASGAEALAQLGVDFLPWLQFRNWRPSTHVGAISPVSASVGSLTLALALFAVGRVRSANASFFIALATIGIAFGTSWKPIVRAWKVVPFAGLAHNENLVFAAALGLVFLATLSIDYAATHAHWRRLALHVAVVTAVLTIITIVFQRFDLLLPWSEVWGNHKQAGEILVPAVAALALLVPARMRRAGMVLIVLLLAQRIIEEGDVYPVVDAAAAYPPIAMLEVTKTVREPFRIAGHWFAFVPGTSAAYGLEDVRGYTAMTFMPFYQTWPLWCVYQPGWFNRVDDLERPFLSFLNVRYAITSSREPDHAGWREVARQNGAKLLENTRVIPRAFIPNELVMGEHDPIEEMKRADDFRTRAWIHTPGPRLEQSNGPGAVAIRRAKPGFTLDVTMDRAGWIVLSEQCWRGWRAYVDKRRVRLFPADLAFIGVYVPEGRHEVEVRYWPESFVIGRAISLAGLVIAIAIAVLVQFRKPIRD